MVSLIKERVSNSSEGPLASSKEGTACYSDRRVMVKCSLQEALRLLAISFGLLVSRIPLGIERLQVDNNDDSWWKRSLNLCEPEYF